MLLNNIVKIDSNVYLVNEHIKIIINEDTSVTADYDEKYYNEDQVNQIIDEIFAGVNELLKQKAKSDN